MLSGEPFGMRVGEKDWGVSPHEPQPVVMSLLRGHSKRSIRRAWVHGYTMRCSVTVTKNQWALGVCIGFLEVSRLLGCSAGAGGGLDESEAVGLGAVDEASWQRSGADGI